MAFAVAAATAASVATAQPSGRIPTVTRLVKAFSDLETKLAANAHSSDAAALDAMLDPAFEMRVGDAPGTPIARDEWIRLARAAPKRPPLLAQMAVHDFGDLAIVSFGDGTASPARFVVDAWRRDGDNWTLTVRYQSDITPKAAFRAKAAPRIEKKY